MAQPSELRADWHGQVNLYSMCDMAIKPSTEESQLSMVEMMSVQEMTPDFFISHVSSQSALARLVVTA